MSAEHPTAIRATQTRATAAPADTLDREEWDFSVFEGWPYDNLRHAWAWEMDRELGSGSAPFITAWELRQYRNYNELLQAHLHGKTELKGEALRQKLEEYLLPEPLHQLDRREADLKAEVQGIEDTLRFEAVENERALKARLRKLKAEKEGLRKKNIRRLKSDLARLQSDIRAREGKGGRLLSEEEYEAICPSPKAAPPKPQPPPTIKSYPLGEIMESMLKRSTSVEDAKKWNFLYGSESCYSTIHAVEIDWTLSETELLEAFRNWLRKAPLPYRPGERSQTKPGRKDGYHAWFRELAIYRLARSGLTRKQGMALLKIKVMSPSNWSHAGARTEKRIKARERELKVVAANAHLWNGSPDWRDNFAEL